MANFVRVPSQDSATSPTTRAKPALGQSAVQSGLAVSFLDRLTLNHGPTALLGRMFLNTDAECRKRGVTLSFGTFDELLAINAANRDTWKPLMPIFDPAFHDFTDDTAIVLIGRNRAGQAVMTNVGLRFDLTGTTYHDYAEQLRVNYARPESMKRPGERCIPSAPSLKLMTGQVLFAGALWFHPSVRSIGLAPYTGRTLRGLALTRWNMDYATAFIVEGPLKGGLAERIGYPNVEWSIAYENTAMGNFTCGLTWMDRAHLLADLETFQAKMVADTAAAAAQTSLRAQTQ
jgi:hypothetical protein